MTAAVNYAIKCMKMRPPWVDYDEWTKSAKYRYIRKSNNETFKKH